MEETDVRRILAENLKTLRKQKGLSQLKLANELQMAFTFINDIENCKKWVSPETLARFATFFGVPLSALFTAEYERTGNGTPPFNTDFFVKTISEEVAKTIGDVARRFGGQQGG